MDFTEVIIQVTILFVVMFLGLFLRSREIISHEGIGGFSRLIFYVTMPAMIIAASGKLGDVTGEVLSQLVIGSLLTYVFLIVMMLILPKIVAVPEDKRGLYRFMTIFANVGFIGYPMLTVIMGEGAVFMGSIFNIPFNALLYTLGVFLIKSDRYKDHRFRFDLKEFMNVGVIATMIALILIVFNIKLPTVVFKTIDTLGGLTTPLAMLVVGASLYGTKVKSVLTNYRVMVFSLLRILLIPLLVGLGLTTLNFDPQVISVGIILIGMPIGTNMVIIARQYESNVIEASEAVFISTILMAISIPYLVWLVSWLP